MSHFYTLKNCLFLFILLLSSCGGKKKETRNSKPSVRRVKHTKVEFPKNIKLGDSLKISIQPKKKNTTIDSVLVFEGNKTKKYLSKSVSYLLDDKTVGKKRLRLKIFSDKGDDNHVVKVNVLSSKEPLVMSYEVVKTFPHNTKDYTQGLLINDDVLYESTGRKGHSSFIKKELETGKAIHSVNIPDDEFGEGLALINDKFYQLTWTTGKAYVYDKEMKKINSFNYQTEGWGITKYNDQLIMSDGSNKLYFIEPNSFSTVKEMEVYDNQGEVNKLNELEEIDGLIYANVYQEDYVVVINPKTGEVEKKIDFSKLLTEEESKKADVLNGIAIDKATNKLYVTGKWWPKLFQVKIKPKTR